MPFPTISYPSPNNSNPAGDPEGFASAATNAYSAGLQHATALRYAAQQDQKQKQDAARQASLDDLKQRNEYATEQEKYRNAGATPMPQYDAAPINGVDATGRPTLRRDQSGVQLDPSLQADDPNHIQTDSHGRAWHYPDLAERKQEKTTPLDDTNSFVPTGDMGKALEAAGWQSGQRITPANLHLMLESANGGNTAEFFHTSDADGATHVYVQDKKNGTVKEIGNFPDSSKGTADKADATQLIPGMLGPSGGPLLLNKKTGGADEVQVPKGSKRAMTPGQEAAAGRSADAATERKERYAREDADKLLKTTQQMQEKHDKSYNDEQDQWELKRRYDAIAAGEEDTAPDPKHPGQAITKADAAGLSKSAAVRALQFQKQSKEVRKQMKWGEFGDQQQAAPAAAATAGPAAAPAQQTPAAPPAAAPAAPPPAAAPTAKPLAPWTGLAKAPAAAAPAPAAASKQTYKEGQTATGPGGKKLVFKGGQWLPQ